MVIDVFEPARGHDLTGHVAVLEMALHNRAHINILDTVDILDRRETCHAGCEVVCAEEEGQKETTARMRLQTLVSREFAAPARTTFSTIPNSLRLASSSRHATITLAPIEYPTSVTGRSPWTLLQRASASTRPALILFCRAIVKGLSTNLEALATARGQSAAESVAKKVCEIAWFFAKPQVALLAAYDSNPSFPMNCHGFTTSASSVTQPDIPMATRRRRLSASLEKLPTISPAILPP
ncbi:hypothetical protein KC340_g30 [Hortaea werneckii]|nr:hypothetical protein KC340_g30 [Hortaea werneckii]